MTLPEDGNMEEQVKVLYIYQKINPQDLSDWEVDDKKKILVQMKTDLGKEFTEFGIETSLASTNMKRQTRANTTI